MKSYRFAVAALALSGCASIASDNQNNIYIETQPVETAYCEINGKSFKRQIEAPSTVNLSAADAPLTVTCKAPGYHPATKTLDTTTDGWIFGNILLGGVVGMTIDSVRGAGEHYPLQLTLTLEPEGFATAAERDDFFNALRDETQTKWNGILADIQFQCSDSVHSSHRDDCPSQLAEARKQAKAELDAVETRRIHAPVGKRP